MICLIKQPAGIGDIFFCQKIGKYYFDRGYEIVWPVNPEILWVKDYINNVKFYSIEDDFPGKEYYDNVGFYESPEFVFIDLLDADRTHNDGKIMSSKYSMVNMDHNDWQDYFNFNRNIEREDILYHEVLGLRDNSNYILVNKYYSTPPNIQEYDKIKIDNKESLDIIEMKIIEGFTLFDWIKVIENANEIYTINTAINYIIDKLNLKSKKNILYAHNNNNLQQIDFLFKTKYIMSE